MEQKLYRPNISQNSYKFGFAYPACESFALSSLGYLWLYKIAEEMDGIQGEEYS